MPDVGKLDLKLYICHNNVLTWCVNVLQGSSQDFYLQQSSVTGAISANPPEVQLRQPYKQVTSRYMGEKQQAVNVSQVKKKTISMGRNFSVNYFCYL